MSALIGLLVTLFTLGALWYAKYKLHIQFGLFLHKLYRHFNQKEKPRGPRY